MKILTRKLILSIFLLALFIPPALFAAQTDVHLTILHVNDMHGHVLPATVKNPDGKASIDNTTVGDAANLAGMIREERAKNPEGTLLLSAGDMFQGTPISNLFKGTPVIEFMNYLEFDAMAVGNHEYDWGLDAFNQLLAAARFPFLSANIQNANDSSLCGVKPYIVMHRRNVNIAVIGLTTPDVAYLSKTGLTGNISAQNAANVLPSIIKKATLEGAQIIIVLSHLGLDADRDLARRVPGIHIIVGGHSHTELMTPVTEGSTVIVQAGCYGLYLGVLELDIEMDKNPAPYRIMKGALRKVTSGPGQPYDEKAARIVNAYRDRIKDQFAEVIGETAIDLTLDDKNESNIGNLICDMMKETTGADMALINSRSMRTNIPQGKITLEQVYTLLPFDNAIATMDLTGRQIMEILEHSAAQPYGRLQVSGITISHDLSKPVGHRVEQVTVGGKPLVPDKTYRIVTNDFLAAGGDRFATFKGGLHIQYGMELRDLFLAYLKKHSPVNPAIEERIIINKRSPITWQMPPYVKNAGQSSICPVMQARCRPPARGLVQPFQTQADNFLNHIDYSHDEYIFPR
jgi:5'-nucleotidase / UDP-sugar diphosphatase